MSIRRFASFFFVTSVVGVAAACSPSSSSGSGGPCGAYFDALTSMSQKCGAALASPTRLPDLRTKFITICQREVSAPGASKASGFIASCTDQINAAQSCSDLGDCTTPTGDLADGAPCGEDFQCSSGHCKIARETGNSGSAASQCGTCAPRAAIGQPCDNASTACVDGATCVSGNSASTCQARKVAKAGEVCFDPKAQTGASTQCDTGLHCPIPDFSTGTPEATKCAPAAQSGEACSSSFDCVIGLSCVDKKCAPGLAEGAACTGTGCAPGLACDPTAKTCAKITFAADGQPCDDAVTHCDSGYCSGAGVTSTGGKTTVTPGICKPTIADGGPCGQASSDASEDPGHCEEFSSCIAGTCQQQDATQCK